MRLLQTGEVPTKELQRPECGPQAGTFVAQAVWVNPENPTQTKICWQLKLCKNWPAKVHAKAAHGSDGQQHTASNHHTILPSKQAECDGEVRGACHSTTPIVSPIHGLFIQIEIHADWCLCKAPQATVTITKAAVTKNKPLEHCKPIFARSGKQNVWHSLLLDFLFYPPLKVSDSYSSALKACNLLCCAERLPDHFFLMISLAPEPLSVGIGLYLVQLKGKSHNTSPASKTIKKPSQKAALCRTKMCYASFSSEKEAFLQRTKGSSSNSWRCSPRRVISSQEQSDDWCFRVTKQPSNQSLFFNV